MMKLSFFELQVMNVKLKNIKLHLKLLNGKMKKKLFVLYTILYRNINKKALKRLHFFDSVVFQQHILILSPSTYIRVGLKAG